MIYLTGHLRFRHRPTFLNFNNSRSSLFCIFSDVQKYHFRQVSQKTMKRKVAEYGTWKSPITSAEACAGKVTFSSDFHVDPVTGLLFWCEQRSSGGKTVVCSYNSVSGEIEEWTGEGYNARTMVHEYGGGAVLPYNGVVYFSNYKDQMLYKQAGPKAAPAPVLEKPSPNKRFADGDYSQKHNKIYYVMEDHSVKVGDVKEAKNCLVCIDPITPGPIVTMEEGADFYSSPRVSPDGKYLVWLQWNHPNMPWDDTQIYVAKLNENGDGFVADSRKLVVGKEDENVIMPTWTKDGDLMYISDGTGWWNIHLLKKESFGSEAINIHNVKDEVEVPHWLFGYRGFSCDYSGTNKIVAVHGKELAIMDKNGENYTAITTGYNCPLGIVVFGHNGRSAYCVVADSTKSQAIARIHINDNYKVEIIKEANQNKIDASYLSVPESISFPTTEDMQAHAYLYMPKNADYVGPDNSRPPVVVVVHGGPTGSCSLSLNLEYQYFTSRGYALLDVNYRGSTGYGKVYRNLLKGKWGEYDVEDCKMGAEHLVSKGLVDAERVCMMGGSAGGYTVLCCLTFTRTFKAGAVKYGIGDLEVLQRDGSSSNKFESQYNFSLIGSYPECADLYRSRSPIHHVDKLSCPVIFYHGAIDKVVPPVQSETMFEALEKKGIPTALVLYPEEGHGFRDSKTKQKTLDGIFYFFARVFGFVPADTSDVEVTISNL